MAHRFGPQTRPQTPSVFSFPLVGRSHEPGRYIRRGQGARVAHGGDPMQEAASSGAGVRALPRRGALTLAVLIIATAAAFPAASEARGPDTDHDGLSDAVEASIRTNPRKADTDGDHLRDGVELRRTHTNPRRSDTDRDGLTDGFEVRRSKTNPRRFDTDGDRMGDGLELLLGRDPLVRERKKPKLAPDLPPAPDPAPQPAPEPPLPLPDIVPPRRPSPAGRAVRWPPATRVSPLRRPRPARPSNAGS